MRGPLFDLAAEKREKGFTHVPRTSPLFSSVFHTASALSAPTGHLPLEGKGGTASAVDRVLS